MVSSKLVLYTRDRLQPKPLNDLHRSTSRRFEFATSIPSTTIPSLIPEVHLSVLPYLSLPAHLLRARALELQQDKGVFGMTFHPAADADKEELKLEAVEADGLIGINNTDFMVSYMSPRWSVSPALSSPIPLNSEFPLPDVDLTRRVLVLTFPITGTTRTS
jgi:hypothetical protein